MSTSIAAGTGAPSSGGYRTPEALAILATLIAASVALNVVILPFTQVADPVRKTFGIDDVQFSFLLGAFFAVPAMVMSVAGGWLADRFSRRGLLIAAMLVWTGGAVWTALAPDYTQLAIARMLVVAAVGVKFPLTMTWLSDAFPPERRGKAIGALFVVLNIGPAIGASIGGVVLQASEAGRLAGLPFIGGLEPWRAALLLMALSNLLVLPWVTLLRDTRSAAPDIGSAASGQAGDGAGAPLRLLALLMLGTALLALADTANLAWLPTVLRRQFAFEAQQAGFTFGLITTTAGLLGSLAGGFLGDWIHKRRGSAGRLAMCALAALVCAPLLATFGGTSARLLIAALVLSGVASVAALTMGYVVIQALLPPQRRGFGSGVAHAASSLAAALAPTLVALIAERLPPGPAALGGGVAIVTVAAFLLAAATYGVLAWRVGRRERVRLGSLQKLAA